MKASRKSDTLRWGLMFQGFSITLMVFVFKKFFENTKLLKYNILEVSVII